MHGMMQVDQIRIMDPAKDVFRQQLFEMLKIVAGCQFDPAGKIDDRISALGNTTNDVIIIDETVSIFQLNSEFGFFSFFNIKKIVEPLLEIPFFDTVTGFFNGLPELTNVYRLEQVID